MCISATVAALSGDAIKFLMDAEHLTFLESVERLVSEVGIQLRYDESGFKNDGPRQQPGQKQRLIAAHAAAAEFYSDQLTTAGARIAREFLAQRGFGRAAAERYGCGFAPDGWDQLTKHLRQKGFTAEELTAGGLAKPPAPARSSTASAAGCSGRSATSPATSSASAPASCSRTTTARST
nr:hypothetical protein GCM10020092_090770 [Actinoplanes digitatis]